MALFKYNKNIMFVQGVNQDEDEKLPTIGLTKAENLVVSKLGNFGSRKGFASLPKQTLEGGLIEKGEMLKSYGNELLLIGRDNLYSYADKISKWVKRSKRLTVVNKSKSFSRSPTSRSNPFYVKGEGDLSLLIYKEENIYYYDIFETTSGLKLASKERLDPSDTVTTVRTIFKNGRFITLHTNSANQLVFRNTEIGGNSLGSPIVLQTDAIDPSLMCVSDYNELWVLVFYKKTNSKPSGFFINSEGVIATPSEGLVNKTEIDIALEDKLSLAVKKGAVPEVFLTHNTPTEVNLTLLTNGLALIETLVVDTVDDVTHISSLVMGTKLRIIFSGLDSAEEYIKRRDFLLDDDTLQTLEPINKDILIASSLFPLGEDAFFIASFDSPLQSCYFIVDSTTGNIEGRVDYLTGSGHVDQLLEPVLEGVNKFSLMTPTKTRIIKDNDTYSSVNGLDLHEFIFETPRNYQASSYSDNLYIAGSVPHLYDSQNLVEDGFLIYPEGVTGIAGTAVDGEMENATSTGISPSKYFYTVVYAWTNAKGILFRGRPSALVQVEMGSSYNSVELTIPTLRLTKKENVVIEIYRSEVNGAVNHKIAEVINDKTVQTITYTDLRGDTDLVTLEPLYTTGGVLENSCPRSCQFTTVYQNRLFLAGLRDNKTIQYSHILREGFPAEFSDFLITTVPVEDDITGIYGLGNFLVIFTARSIGILVGEGADVTGVGASFRFESLSKDIGCRTFHSFLETRQGLYFQSGKGIYLLTREGGLDFVGSKVKDNELEITSTQHTLNSDELRFNTRDYTLVYNEYYKVWTTFTNVSGMSTTVHSDGMYRLGLDGETVYKESDDYSDDGTGIVTKLRTNWVTAEQLGSYQRVYKVAFAGINREHHQGRINIYYNYSKDLGESFDYSTQDTSHWGETTWGEVEALPTNTQDFFFEARLRKQKCTSVCFEIESVLEDNAPTKGGAFSGVVFTLGAKRGMRKVGTNNRAKKSVT